jgi:hypothetical protein
VKELHKLYNFSAQKRSSFHDSIDSKHNVLLVCQTVEGIIVGAFTTACFSLESNSSPTVAFLFGLRGDKLSLSLLKAGRESVSYDADFLIYGNDELCIERGKSALSSYCLNALSS